MLRVLFFGVVQEAARSDLGDGIVLLLLVLAFGAHRLSAAVGSAGVLGDGRHDQHRARARRSSAAYIADSCEAAPTSAPHACRWYAAHVSCCLRR